MLTRSVGFESVYWRRTSCLSWQNGGFYCRGVWYWCFRRYNQSTIEEGEDITKRSVFPRFFTALHLFLANFSCKESPENVQNFFILSGSSNSLNGNRNSSFLLMKPQPMKEHSIASLDGLLWTPELVKLRLYSAQRSGVFCRHIHVKDSSIGRLFMGVSTPICCIPWRTCHSSFNAVSRR